MNFEELKNRYFRNTDYSKENLFQKNFLIIDGFDEILEIDIQVLVTSHSLRRNIEDVTAIKHPNIQRCYGEVEVDFFDKNERHIFLLEKCNVGSFSNFLKSFPNEMVVFQIIKDTLNGLVNIHNIEMAYGSFSSRDILVHEDHYGLKGKLSIAPMLVETIKKTEQDTAGFEKVIASPEVYEDGSPTLKSDIWSIGAMLYELFSGESPFDFTQRSLEENYEENINNIPAPYDGLIRKSLIPQQDNRADSKQLLEIMNPEE